MKNMGTQDYCIRTLLSLMFLGLSISLFAKRMTVNGTVADARSGEPKEYTISKVSLQDKIKGGWAGQTIGCTFGGPTEFRYNGTTINDSIRIEWPEGRIKWYYDNAPGLYDDIYMDLTFVNVFDKDGLDAPISSFEKAFSTAEYPLWHANQQARYNILNGIKSPSSGYWENNPHADDIDFQIEADYAGLMAPGMPNAAIGFTDGIGHMMNYGDGWYGGVYVAAMYSLAFISDDIEYIATEALKAIPQESRYYKCMADVIKWHEQYPEAWELTWALCQKFYSFDIGCPDGVFDAFDIDAVINSAYILIGLLYGEKDFGRTIEIATRCGYDSDCNPASAGGILGTILGYDNIPEYWKKNLYEVEDRDFAYTEISLNDVYKMSYNQALKVIERNGGTVSDGNVVIKSQVPETVRLEQSFPNLRPASREEVNKEIREAEPIKFSGKGIVVGYSFSKDRWTQLDESEYVAEVEVMIDGQSVEKVLLPTKTNLRKQELFYKYDLNAGEHALAFRWKNPEKGRNIYISYYIPYK
jgi:hypothetical protein